MYIGICGIAQKSLAKNVQHFRIKGLITVWLMLGWAKFALKAFNGETLNPADILSQTDKILAGFAAYLLYTVIVTLGILLLIVPGLYLASRLFFLTISSWKRVWDQ